MLPPFIIEQIRQREEQERLRRSENRPRLELPIEGGKRRSNRSSTADEDDAERGVVIVDLMG